MNPKLFTLFGVLVALSGSCFVRSAFGEADGGLPGSNVDRAPARTSDSVAAPLLDPHLWARLEEQEAARRGERNAALKDPDAWEANRPQRASAHRAQLAAFWGSIVGTLDGQARLRMHAERMARLNRILDLAQLKQDPALVARVQADIKRELMRHVQVMQALQAASGVR
jgi:hypothetical protein